MKHCKSLRIEEKHSWEETYAFNTTSSPKVGPKLKIMIKYVIFLGNENKVCGDNPIVSGNNNYVIGSSVDDKEDR